MEGDWLGAGVGDGVPSHETPAYSIRTFATPGLVAVLIDSTVITTSLPVPSKLVIVYDPPALNLASSSDSAYPSPSAPALVMVTL